MVGAILAEYLECRGHRSRFTEDLPEQQGKSKFQSVGYIRLLSKVKAEFDAVHL
jgi:hypothetical protein